MPSRSASPTVIATLRTVRPEDCVAKELAVPRFDGIRPLSERLGKNERAVAAEDIAAHDRMDHRPVGQRPPPKTLSFPSGFGSSSEKVMKEAALHHAVGPGVNPAPALSQEFKFTSCFSGAGVGDVASELRGAPGTVSFGAQQIIFLTNATGENGQRVPAAKTTTFVLEAEHSVGRPAPRAPALPAKRRPDLPHSLNPGAAGTGRLAVPLTELEQQDATTCPASAYREYADAVAATAVAAAKMVGTRQAIQSNGVVVPRVLSSSSVVSSVTAASGGITITAASLGLRDDFEPLDRPMAMPPSLFRAARQQQAVSASIEDDRSPWRAKSAATLSVVSGEGGQGGWGVSTDRAGGLHGSALLRSLLTSEQAAVLAKAKPGLGAILARASATTEARASVSRRPLNKEGLAQSAAVHMARIENYSEDVLRRRLPHLSRSDALKELRLSSKTRPA